MEVVDFYSRSSQAYKVLFFIMLYSILMMIKTKLIPGPISSVMYREVQGKIIGTFFQKRLMKKSCYMG